jgi:2-hydroxyglutarate dehydrogenase
MRPIPQSGRKAMPEPRATETISPHPPASCDVVVVGGGILGLATAREALIRRPGSSVVVLEREPEVALHQTSHNSGVIHAGVYYVPGSLKARLCVEGARRLYELCDELGVRAERCGKLIVARTQAELPRLDELERRAQANGVRIRRIAGGQIGEIEPHARGLAALHSPDTGIVDFERVAHALRADLKARGGSIVTGCHVERAARRERRRSSRAPVCSPTGWRCAAAHPRSPGSSRSAVPTSGCAGPSSCAR